MSKTKTSVQILAIAREILAKEGFSAVSFDAIARRLGKSKQAVLYWFPTKHDLLAAMFLPWLEAETESAISALSGATNRTEAIGLFIRAVAQFHLEDLDRFRMMYLVPQTTSTRPQEPGNAAVVNQVHPVTTRLYAALADHLGTDPVAARAQAVAIHAAVLGLILMVALGESLNDPLKQSETQLVDALVNSLTAT
ncbi:TetR/AcrR family transcriptional regulator [Thalassovita sp.]|uniref:TetR/AcrR family transcriptional regulator n=1 Tax=Thalassovita sp. TaxID=1979401 RepID=UPI002B27347A|nr:TetR/AcrR family transcriptional regulator [Thalassovita sp.]